MKILLILILTFAATNSFANDVELAAGASIKIGYTEVSCLPSGVPPVCSIDEGQGYPILFAGGKFVNSFSNISDAQAEMASMRAKHLCR